jgi:hypothetical protein
MKTIKKTALALLTVFMGSLFVNAQDLTNLPKQYKSYDAEKRAKDLTDKMDEKLNLDDAQVDQIYNINLKYALERDSIVKIGADKATTQKALEQSWNKREGEFKKVLNSTQAIEYEYKKEEITAQAKQVEDNNAAADKAKKEKSSKEKPQKAKKKSAKKK